MDIDFETEPLGRSADGKDVFLHDIWPTRQQIQEVEKRHVIPGMFKEVYARIKLGSESWQRLLAPEAVLYPWDDSSTYIKKPPFFAGMTKVSLLVFFLVLCWIPFFVRSSQAFLKFKTRLFWSIWAIP